MIPRFKLRQDLHPARLTVLVGLVLAGCVQPSDPVAMADALPAADVHADTVVVRAANDQLTGTIVATYTNRTSRPAYLGTCGISSRPGFSMDKEVGGNWVLSYDPVCALTAGPPFEVLPGESRTDTLPVWDTLQPNSLRYFQTQEVPGTYRIVYHVYDCCATPPGGMVRHGTRLPREEHVSEAFRIDLAD